MNKFAVIGHPIDHSFSPVMHEASFKQVGFSGSYEKIDVTHDDLPALLDRLQAEGYRGINVTIPHKQNVLSYLDTLSPEAEQLSSVNTITFGADGLRHGSNSDAPGFILAAKQVLGYEAAGTTVAILGCGGVGRAIALTLAEHGVHALILIDAYCSDAALALQIECKSFYPKVKTTCITDRAAITQALLAPATLIVQGTPSGLDMCPAPALMRDCFTPGQQLFDVVVCPTSLETPTMREALAAGIACTNGIPLLVAQGAISFNTWTGLSADESVMTEAIVRAISQGH